MTETTSFSLAGDLMLALRLADVADAQTRSRFDSADLGVRLKADRTHVTDADLAAETAIRALLTQERPSDGIFGEEFGTEGDSNRQWIIDPIDGTANFLRGVPLWGTMIALAVDGEPVVGVVSMPSISRRWWAAEGLGAHTNTDDGTDRDVHVSAVAHLSDASLSAQSIRQWDDAGYLDALIALSRNVWRDRAYGDVYSYMLLAEGRVDIVGEFDIKPYDIAAAVAIVREAGGMFTAIDGNTLGDGSALATNGLLHAETVAFIAATQAQSVSGESAT